jgi:hypothetical protein
MNRLCASLMRDFEQRYGYPPDDHHVAGPTRSTVLWELRVHRVLPGDIVDFYERIGAVVLPDVHVGYFVHDLDAVTSGIAGDLPTRVRGSVEAEVVCFGSDGGGELFALDVRDGGPVYRLPCSAMDGQVYEESDLLPVEVVARSFPDFLTRLRAATANFVDGLGGDLPRP